MSWSVHDAVEFVKRGVPAIVIATNTFEIMAILTAKNLGGADIPIITVPHPIGGLKIEEVKMKGDIIIEKLVKTLG
jgi:hypothetical protein